MCCVLADQCHFINLQRKANRADLVKETEVGLTVDITMTEAVVGLTVNIATTEVVVLFRMTLLGNLQCQIWTATRLLLV